MAIVSSITNLLRLSDLKSPKSKIKKKGSKYFWYIVKIGKEQNKVNNKI